MRILHCIPTLGGGGAERQMAYLAAALMKRGGDVHVAYMRTGPNFDRLYGSGVTLHELSCVSNYDPRIPYQLLRVIKRTRPDVVQAWLPQMVILGGWAAIQADVPFIVSERSCSMAYQGTWKDWLRVRIASRAVAVVANSQGGKAYWMNRTPAPIELIRNGIPFSEIEEVTPISDDEAELESGVELILFAGRFSPEKNLRRLSEALRLVLSRRELAVAVLLGGGPLRNEIINQIKTYGLGDRLRVLDFSTRLWSWMKRAKAFISVSLYEGSPNTVLEAAACGAPLILSDIPQHRELFDDSAYFVPVFAPAEIAEGVLRALTYPQEARQKAAKARAKISPWSVGAVLEQYLSLYGRTRKRPAGTANV